MDGVRETKHQKLPNLFLQCLLNHLCHIGGISVSVPGKVEDKSPIPLIFFLLSVNLLSFRIQAEKKEQKAKASFFLSIAFPGWWGDEAQKERTRKIIIIRTVWKKWHWIQPDNLSQKCLKICKWQWFSATTRYKVNQWKVFFLFLRVHWWNVEQLKSLWVLWFSQGSSCFACFFL